MDKKSKWIIGLVAVIVLVGLALAIIIPGIINSYEKADLQDQIDQLKAAQESPVKVEEDADSSSAPAEPEVKEEEPKDQSASADDAAEDKPSDQIMVDGKPAGIDLGDRIVFTCGKYLTDKNPGTYGDDLSKIEQTWVENIQVTLKPGQAAVAFATNIRPKGKKDIKPGVILKLEDQMIFDEKNGEIVIFKDGEEDMLSEVENRIAEQVEKGNLDIKGPLALKYVSEIFEKYLPKELLDARKIRLIS